MSRLPLEGTTVVAIEQAVAAPFASSRLADAGARVLKIERPEGDFARGYDKAARGCSSYFVWLNRGKDSIVLDLASPAGKAHLQSLIVEADVVLQNLRPGALAGLGFDTAAMRGLNRRLITCSITGYGEGGPLAGRKAYDLLIQAESGLASITGSADQPARVGISVVDVATGATAHAAILEALLLRDRTGQGSDITISMFDVMADWLTVPLLNHEAGQSPRRLGLAHPSIAPYGVFGTVDNRDILVAVQSDREWRTFARAILGRPELADDDRFRTNSDRVANRTATDAAVAAAIRAMTRPVAETRLAAAGIAFAGVNDMADLARHPHLRRIEVETPNGAVSYPAPAAIFADTTRSYGRVPALGEHSEREP